VRVVDRGTKVVIVGDDAETKRAGALLSNLLEAVRGGHTPTLSDLELMLENGAASSESRLPHGEKPSIIRHDVQVHPRTQGQREYLDMIAKCDITLATGPAGTGKTYLAMAAAVSALLSQQVKRLILTRPAIEAGESLGFLPGDLEQKVNPYLRPLYDALYTMVDLERVQRLIEQGRIEVVPLAFMRGRTLDQAFAILDEGQNTTTDQMIMFLTRLGQGSKAVITGDITQTDLPRGKQSGLVEAKRILSNVPGIGTVSLSKGDVVRNPLVQRVIDAYEADKQAIERAEGAGPPADPGTAGEQMTG